MFGVVVVILTVILNGFPYQHLCYMKTVRTKFAFHETLDS